MWMDDVTDVWWFILNGVMGWLADIRFDGRDEAQHKIWIKFKFEVDLNWFRVGFRIWFKLNSSWIRIGFKLNAFRHSNWIRIGIQYHPNLIQIGFKFDIKIKLTFKSKFNPLHRTTNISWQLIAFLFHFQPHEIRERIMNVQNELQFCKSKVSFLNQRHCIGITQWQSRVHHGIKRNILKNHK